MFTGIVESTGIVKTIKAYKNQGHQQRLTIEATFKDAVLGESIAVNGVCLTVSEIPESGVYCFFVSSETLARSNLGTLKESDEVNLERALQLNSRLSGHLVQGHVDGLGKLSKITKIDDSHELEISLPESLLSHCIEKGSIALDGISLTINEVLSSGIKLMIIPHTWNLTNLKAKKEGEHFNVEADVVSKYIKNHLMWSLNEHRRNQ